MNVAVDRPPLVAQRRPAQLPLSYSQQRLWFAHQLEAARHRYVIFRARRLSGRLDRDALRRALRALVARHETLRTSIEPRDGTPVQVVAPDAHLELRVDDLRALDDVAQRARMVAMFDDDITTPFDLTRAPLLRMRLLHCGDDDHVLAWAMHHIVSDGWSQRVFYRDLVTLYNAYASGRADPLPPLPIQYVDFTLWQRAWVEDEGQGGLAYWQQQLAGVPDRLELPADASSGTADAIVPRLRRLLLSAEHTASLKQVSRTHHVTLYILLLSAYAMLLSRYSGQDDVVVGLPVANRQARHLENVIGCFVNVLPLRMTIRAASSLRAIVAQVQSVVRDAHGHQDVPFERLASALGIGRHGVSTPVFQTVFASQSNPKRGVDWLGLTMEYVPNDAVELVTDLDVHAWEWSGRIGIRWKFNASVYAEWRIEQMMRHYVRVLDAFSADMEQPVGDIDLLTMSDRAQLLEAVNTTDHVVPFAPFAAQFEAQVARTPDAIAVVDPSGSLTYGALNAEANRLAQVLVRDGVGPESLVAVALPRSPRAVVAILAAAKAGAASVPIDPAGPAERLAFIIDDASPSSILTGEGTEIRRHTPADCSEVPA
jgi:hypothetical protein